jgi:hypothetical protein
MADGIENQQPPAQTPPAQTPPPAQTQQQPDPAQVELQKKLDEALSKLGEYQTKEQQAQREKEEADRKKAEENGEFKTLLEKAEAEKEQLKTELAKRDREALLNKVATKHKLPAEIAARLVGETEADLEKDAEKLAKVVQTQQTPPAGNGQRPRPAAPTPNTANQVPPSFRAKF